MPFCWCLLSLESESCSDSWLVWILCGFCHPSSHADEPGFVLKSQWVMCSPERHDTLIDCDCSLGHTSLQIIITCCCLPGITLHCSANVDRVGSTLVGSHYVWQIFRYASRLHVIKPVWFLTDSFLLFPWIDGAYTCIFFLKITDQNVIISTLQMKELTQFQLS